MEFELIQTGLISLLPPLLAITLALLTKEVYSSLFLGLFSGTVIYAVAGGHSLRYIVMVLFDTAASKIAANVYMIVFLALLWAVVVLVSESGGSEAYGRFAEKRLKSKRGAGLAAVLLGILIFIDDGFNCLTVGTVMRPIFDKFRLSREKLAYILDSTAAPICIIAPVSSWAVAIASEVGDGGFSAFLATIPYNFYAWLTLAALLFFCLTGRDFGRMKRAEEACLKDVEETPPPVGNPRGRVIDLVLPIAVLVVCSVLGMGYVGGFFSGVPFTEAIGENPTKGFALGAFAALLCAAALCLPRKLMTLKHFAKSVGKGVVSIVPPMLILILSWSLSGVCHDLIGTGAFISGFIADTPLPLSFLPLLLFVVAAAMAFSMGTSWGTFSILIPIVTMICASPAAAAWRIPLLGATLSGSVFGDHCSPISDTTILSSTGAACPHIRHVETQLPYAATVAAVCAVGYLLIGCGLPMPVALALCVSLLAATLWLMSREKNKA